MAAGDPIDFVNVAYNAMQETVFTHGYNQKIFKNLRELVTAEGIDLLDYELRTLELDSLQIRRSARSDIVSRIDGFHSEITFMLRSFFFTFLGLIYTFAGVTELLIGLAISILLHITRYLAFKIGTVRSPLKSDSPAIGLIVGQGVAAAVKF